MNTQVATTREPSPQEVVRAQLDKMDSEIEKVLPEHVSLDKFKRVVQTAITRNPDLMSADRRSLFAACLDSATDGLVPDGREAALVVFNTKESGAWIKKVQYMPMIAGVYKKVRNAGEISTLSAHVVHTNDAFEYWVDEDGPHLRHTPLLIGERGEVTLVYAVCKLKDGSIEIEPMTKAEIEDVRAVSKSGKNGPWANWWGEMARKTVVRRLSKRLPMSSDLERLMRRDDSMYDLDQEQAPTVEPPPRPQRVAYQPEPPPQGEDFDQRYRETMTVDEPQDGQPGANGEAAEPGAPADRPFLADDGRAIIYDGAGKELNRYERPSNFFKAVLAQIPKEDDPRAFVESNAAAANHFVSKDESQMAVWDECSKAAADAQAAQEAMA